MGGLRLKLSEKPGGFFRQKSYSLLRTEFARL